MNVMGISEALIFSGTALIVSGTPTHGWWILGFGVLTGFLRYAQWWGQKSLAEEQKNETEIEKVLNALAAANEKSQ